MKGHVLVFFGGTHKKRYVSEKSFAHLQAMGKICSIGGKFIQHEYENLTDRRQLRGVGAVQ